MSTVAEFDLSASFDLDIFELLKTLRQHVEQGDLVLNCHNDMESTRVESYCKSIFRHGLGDLQGLCDVVPDLDGSVFGACDDKLLSDADIKTCNLLGVVATVDEINF